MNDTTIINSVDVVILCGGKGERLKAISGDLPKVLVKVAGRPFLDFLIGDLRQQGFRRIILSVGYKREDIRNHCLAAGHNVEFSEEETPLGTGGAVKKTAPMIHSQSFIVMNGDSICPVDLSLFYDFHVQKGGILSMVLVRPQAGKDYGIIEVDDEQRIKSFREKEESGAGMFVNGGIYFMRRKIFDYMPEKHRFSLEYDFFPKILSVKCYGFLTDVELIDIGTPERYVNAEQRLSKIQLKQD